MEYTSAYDILHLHRCRHCRRRRRRRRRRRHRCLRRRHRCLRRRRQGGQRRWRLRRSRKSDAEVFFEIGAGKILSDVLFGNLGRDVVGLSSSGQAVDRVQLAPGQLSLPLD